MLLGSSLVGASGPGVLLALGTIAGGPASGSLSVTVPVTLTATGSVELRGSLAATVAVSLTGSGVVGLGVTQSFTDVSTTDGASFTSRTFYPDTGDTLLVTVTGDTAAINTATLTPSDTLTLGWTSVDDFTATGNAKRNAAWISQQTSDYKAQAITISSSLTLTGLSITVQCIAGFPVVVQAKHDAGSGGTPSVSGLASISSSSLMVGVIQTGGNPAAVSPPSGWTEDADTGYPTPTHGVESAYRKSGESGTAVTWGSTVTGTWVATAIELSAGTVNTRGHYRVYDFSIPAKRVLRIYQHTADPDSKVINGLRPIQYMLTHNQWGNNGTDVPNSNVAWQETFAYGCAGVFIQDRKHEDDVTAPGMLTDDHLGVQWIIARAAYFNLDTTRVGFFGVSAGAHKGAILALSGGDALVGGTDTPSGHIKAVFWQFGHSGRFRQVDPSLTALGLAPRAGGSVPACCASSAPYSPEAKILGGDTAPLVPCAQGTFDWASGDSGSLDTSTTAVANLSSPSWWAARFAATGTHKVLFNLWHGDADSSIPFHCTYNPKTVGSGHALDNGFQQDLIAAGWTSQQAQYTILAGGTHNGNEFLPSSNPSATNGAAVDAAVRWLLAASQIYQVGSLSATIPVTLTATGSVELRGSLNVTVPVTLTATGTVDAIRFDTVRWSVAGTGPSLRVAVAGGGPRYRFTAAA